MKHVPLDYGPHELEPGVLNIVREIRHPRRPLEFPPGTLVTKGKNRGIATADVMSVLVNVFWFEIHACRWERVGDLQLYSGSITEKELKTLRYRAQGLGLEGVLPELELRANERNGLR